MIVNNITDFDMLNWHITKTKLDDVTAMAVVEHIRELDKGNSMELNYTGDHFSIEVVSISMDAGKTMEYKMYLKSVDTQHVLGQFTVWHK